MTEIKVEIASVTARPPLRALADVTLAISTLISVMIATLHFVPLGQEFN